MSDPALQTAALGALEFLINKALELDPATQKRLAGLNGKVLKIHCQSPELSVYCLPGLQGIKLQSWCEQKQVNSSISGNFSDYIQLLQAEDKAAALINGSLNVYGDSGDFIALQSALADLDIDWEKPLADLLGDVGGHQLGQIIRGIFGLGRQLNTSVQEQLEEFVHKEARILPPREELEEFYTDVSTLSVRVDRLQARIERLKSSLQR